MDENVSVLILRKKIYKDFRKILKKYSIFNNWVLIESKQQSELIHLPLLTPWCD